MSLAYWHIYCGIVTLPYCHTLIPQYCHTTILQYCNTTILPKQLQIQDSAILPCAHSLAYWVRILTLHVHVYYATDAWTRRDKNKSGVTDSASPLTHTHRWYPLSVALFSFSHHYSTLDSGPWKLYIPHKIKRRKYHIGESHSIHQPTNKQTHKLM